MGDKTEDPTPKRLRDAKKKGQVAMSKDLTTAFLFIVSFSLLLKTGGGISDAMKINMKEYITMAVTSPDMKADAYADLGVAAIMLMLKSVAPLLGGVFIIAAAISYVQVGSIFTFEPMKPDLKKLNPLQGVKKWFSIKSIVELLKSVIKLVIVMFMAYKVLFELLRPIVLSVGKPLEHQSIFLEDMITSFTIRVAVVFVIIGAADFFFQKKQHMKQMKMSKDEVKREYKEDEGDPMFKHKRKELAHELVFNNMMKNTRKATAVVVNPVHVAVAIFYDRNKGGAPQVLAKGRNLIAEQIKQIAKEEGIPIMRNVSLAHALNKVELGEEIPEDLYQAVAEVLNFIYKLGQQGGGRRKTS
jgi:flagellar biosynthetic protein FlhB